jgi:hypothetical protein
MPRKLPSRDPIGMAHRHSHAQRRIGPGRKCVCGETRPEALIAGSEPMTCARCSRQKKGQSAFDRHHIAGKANDSLTLDVPVNDHRAILSPAMYDWPKDTLGNPDKAPSLAIAARLRGYCDTVVFLMDRFLLRSAEELESQHSRLVGMHVKTKEKTED